jgi:starch synthase
MEEIDLGGAQVMRMPLWASLVRNDLPRVMQSRETLARLFAQWRPDVLHLFGLMRSVYYYLGCRPRIHCPVLYTEQVGRWQTLFPDGHRRATSSVDWCAACSADSADLVRRNVPECRDRISIIPNGVPVADDLSLAPAPLDVPVLLCIGRHSLVQKGFDVALQALPAVLRHIPAARLVIAGDGPDRQALEQQATALGLSAQVAFPGRVQPADVAGVVRSCTLMLVPSRFEPFGLVAAEAGACGRACIASRVGGLAEVVEDGITGLLVPPEDPQALAEAACTLLADPARLAAMGRAAHERVRRLFRFERFAQDYEALYHRLASAAPRAGHRLTA